MTRGVQHLGDSLRDGRGLALGRTVEYEHRAISRNPRDVHDSNRAIATDFDVAGYRVLPSFHPESASSAID
ncbi:hypothetical protein ACFFQF_25330 [Haladaptatus pallidirubidus]|uniref:hypothetical protein n=1 Tax=Haladaptatus pallidirubidus TaxID=1008152 RepID=UPI001D115408|nr:hypothetical protein [Haladaptatus pallidirubidus]